MTTATNDFSIEGSKVDLNKYSVPNFSRPSPVYLERIVDDSLQLYPVGAFCPAFDSERSAFLLEPSGVNLVTWNLDLSQSMWLKGSNVTIRSDYATAPDSSYLADRVLWGTGTGATQVLRRIFTLRAGQQFYLSAILRLVGALFGSQDCIRITSGVVGTPKVSLSQLNASPNRYRLLELPFTTAGRQPVAPGNLHEIVNYAITAVTANTLTITIPAGYSVAENAWQGGQLAINNQNYLISSNTALSGGSIIVTVATATLLSNGVSTAMRAELQDAPDQEVTIEFYSESTANIDWGGLQLEERPFRTSMSYQEAEMEVRASTLLQWRKSPIANLKSFGFYAELIEWRGDGNLFHFGNLSATIVAGKLKMFADSVEINLTDTLPRYGVKFFVQVQEANSSLSLYINGILRARTTVNNFRGNLTAPLILTSEGVRTWQRLLVRDRPILEGQVSIGEAAQQEVKDLFDTDLLIDATAISAHAPLVILGPITIPAISSPIAQSTITAVNTGTGVVGVVSATGFAVGVPVVVTRENFTILRTTITTIAGLNITLAAAFGAAIGDRITYGQVELPGTASVRFPFDPVDPQVITAIDVGNKRITIPSVLSFTKSRAFVRNNLYQEVAEFIIRDIDNTNNWLIVDDMTGIAVGQTISQPLNELIVDPDNYFAVILDPVVGVSVGEKWNNGLVLENTNRAAVTVNPAIRVYL